MDYFPYKVADCYLYFTSHCIVRAEPFHTHAGDEERSESSSVKFFISADGSCIVKDNENKKLSDRQVTIISKFIQEHYLQMYERWKKTWWWRLLWYKDKP